MAGVQFGAVGFPSLATREDVAKACGLSLGVLNALVGRGPGGDALHYRRYRIPKPSGGSRKISSPSANLRVAQSWILYEILARGEVSEYAHGFVSGRNTLTNASLHVGQAAVVNLDLQDFFPSVSFRRVEQLFLEMGYNAEVADVLAALCTEPTSAGRCLPQGACTSPQLTNLLCRTLDLKLAALADERGFAYSRYADDLTFSGGSLADAHRLLWAVRGVIRAEGFRENRAKQKTMSQHRRQEVTGVVVNVAPTIGRAERRKLRAILHNAEVHGLEAANREGIPEFASHLAGLVGYAAMVEPHRAVWWKERLAAAMRGPTSEEPLVESPEGELESVPAEFIEVGVCDPRELVW